MKIATSTRQIIKGVEREYGRGLYRHSWDALPFEIQFRTELPLTSAQRQAERIRAKYEGMVDCPTCGGPFSSPMSLRLHDSIVHC